MKLILRFAITSLALFILLFLVLYCFSHTKEEAFLQASLFMLIDPIAEILVIWTRRSRYKASPQSQCSVYGVSFKMVRKVMLILTVFLVAHIFALVLLLHYNVHFAFWILSLLLSIGGYVLVVRRIYVNTLRSRNHTPKP